VPDRRRFITETSRCPIAVTRPKPYGIFCCRAFGASPPMRPLKPGPATLMKTAPFGPTLNLRLRRQIPNRPPTSLFQIFGAWRGPLGHTWRSLLVAPRATRARSVETLPHSVSSSGGS
jgi:hypothetical protein